MTVLWVWILLLESIWRLQFRIGIKLLSIQFYINFKINIVPIPDQGISWYDWENSEFWARMDRTAHWFNNFERQAKISGISSQFYDYNEIHRKTSSQFWRSHKGNSYDTWLFLYTVWRLFECAKWSHLSGARQNARHFGSPRVMPRKVNKVARREVHFQLRSI